MTTPLLQKLGIKPGMRAILIDAPAEAADAIGLPDEQHVRNLADEFDYIHLFVTTQNAMHTAFPKMKTHLRAGGMLWVSWPKGRGLGTDLTVTRVIEIGYDYGLVESKTISINATWSAIKFTHPIQGKQYNNSYGELKT